MADRCFYLGSWERPGIELRGPHGKTSGLPSQESWGLMCLDAQLAPRLTRDGSIGWSAQVSRDQRLRFESDSEECRQGQFLLHHLPNGFTAIQWWDRCQGDKRGAINSTILLEGEHTSAEMLAALAQHFPHVLENLKRAGVELVEVRP